MSENLELAYLPPELVLEIVKADPSIFPLVSRLNKQFHEYLTDEKNFNYLLRLTTKTVNTDMLNGQTILNDIKVGPWTSYYTSGRIKEIKNYVLGKLDGPYEIRYDNENNTPMELGYYKNNRRSGIWSKYTTSGVLDDRLHYKNGQIYLYLVINGRKIT